jgi:hypothetical protein
MTRAHRSSRAESAHGTTAASIRAGAEPDSVPAQAGCAVYCKLRIGDTDSSVSSRSAGLSALDPGRSSAENQVFAQGLNAGLQESFLVPSVTIGSSFGLTNSTMVNTFTDNELESRGRHSRDS